MDTSKPTDTTLPSYQRREINPGSGDEFAANFHTLAVQPLPTVITEAVRAAQQPRSVSPAAQRAVVRDFLNG